MDKKINKFIIPLLITSVLINLFMFFKMSNMENKLQSLNNQINNIVSHVDNSINGISYSVSQALKEEASIINDFQFKYGEFKDEYVDLNLSVRPKIISDKNKYYFSYSFEDGKSNTVSATKDDGNKYYANIEVPIKENIQVDFVIDDGNSKTVEDLDYIYNFEERLLSPFDFNRNGGIGYSYSNNILTLNGVGYSITYNYYEYEEDGSTNKSLENVKMYVSVNDNIIDSFPMEEEDNFPRYLDIYTYKFDEYSVKLSPNDNLEVYAIAEHKDGYKVQITLEQYSLDKKGEPIDNINYREPKFIVIFNS